MKLLSTDAHFLFHSNLERSKIIVKIFDFQMQLYFRTSLYAVISDVSLLQTGKITNFRLLLQKLR